MNVLFPPTDQLKQFGANHTNESIHIIHLQKADELSSTVTHPWDHTIFQWHTVIFFMKIKPL